jgi:flagellin-like hook-associated protein FlgL
MSGMQLSMSSVILNSVDRTKASMNNVQTQLTTGKRTLDAAEQGVVTRLSSQMNGYTAASNNITKSQNVINVAQTGLKAISDILIQMKDLAGKTNDSTMSTADKAKLNQTFASLLKQVDDLATSSQVDGVSLLSGSATDMKVQTGLTSSDQITVTAQKVDTATLAIDTLDISATGDSAAAVDALQAAIDSVSASQSSLAADKIGLNARSETIASINDNLDATINSIQKPNMEKLQTQLNDLNAQQSINYYLINQTNQQTQSMLSIFR